MIEGWLEDQYLVIFDDDEVDAATDRYECRRFLPDFEVVGLVGWDDLLVRDPSGTTFRVPSVPLIEDHLSSWVLPSDLSSLETDDRFIGRIKWYLKPVMFGGDPESKENLVWLTHEQHGEAVTWWNNKYREVKAFQGAE
jgi:hypothetical protein